MSTSIFALQRSILLEAIYSSRRRDPRTGQFIQDDSLNRIVVLDDQSAKILANIMKKDDILHGEGILDVCMIYQDRSDYSSDDVVYVLSPQPPVIDWLKDDLQKRRHQRSFLIWIAQPPKELLQSLSNSEGGSELLNNARTLWIDFYSTEARLVVLQDLNSFQICFNQSCDAHVMRHLYTLAHKIVAVCLTLGEYPIVRYYSPQDPLHRAAVLCRLLAERVQSALDFAQKQNMAYPSPLQRPQSVLVITDRSMDLMAPLVHEMSYQAAAVDLMPAQEVYNKSRDIDVKVVLEESKPSKPANPSDSGQKAEEPQGEIKLDEQDEVWVDHRHTQMGDLLSQLPVHFENFIKQYSQYQADSGTNMSVIRDQVAFMHDYVKKKADFELHINMASKCSEHFGTQSLWLPDDPEGSIVSLEQSLATGLDGYDERPKHLADQLVKLLDPDNCRTIPENRLRLLIMYILFRDGILKGDMEKLRTHSNLTLEQDRQRIYNLGFLGARIEKELKGKPQPGQSINQDPKGKSGRLFEPRKQGAGGEDLIAISRFQPAIKYMLEELCRNTLDVKTFPYIIPQLDASNALPTASQSSLRTGNRVNPNWAKQPSASKPRQRVMVFMAGGATYSESRACYEISQQKSLDKDVFLITTEMLKPSVFLDQLGKLSLRPEQALERPPDQTSYRPPPAANPVPPQAARPPPQQQMPPPSNGRRPSDRPPVAAMQNMNLNAPRPQNGPRPGSSNTPTPPSTAGSFSVGAPSKSEEKEKKRRFLGIGRKH